jgi:glycine dehydrogenase subunit 1
VAGTDYVPHSADDVRSMLAAVGVAEVDDLFAEIPEAVRRREALPLPPGLAEVEVAAELRRLADRDTPATRLVSFLGAGVYDHYVPAVVDAIVSRGEFLTAYTPYQPERSQGVLQTVFEYQTAICELTGMDVSNASMYDGGTALAEASILAGAQTRRGEIVLSAGVHPEYRQVLETETAGYGPRPRTVGLLVGAATDLEALAAAVGDDTAAVVVQQPNFFGALEDLDAVAAIAHDAGALLVVVADPLSLGLLEAPGSAGADIVIGEAQALGNAMNFGGPGIGFMAVTHKLMRRLPGRLVGETVDLDGRRGFVLTLQTREQHIRREKATSNICSNHALNALATLVYLSWLGKEGLPELGELCVRKAAYLRQRLLALPGVAAFTEGPVFREFAVRLPLSADEIVAALVPEGFLAGVDAGRFAAQFAGHLPATGDAVPAGDPGEAAAAETLRRVLLVAVTEKRTRAEMDAFVDALGALLQRKEAGNG